MTASTVTCWVRSCSGKPNLTAIWPWSWNHWLSLLFLEQQYSKRTIFFCLSTFAIVGEDAEDVTVGGGAAATTGAVEVVTFGTAEEPEEDVAYVSFTAYASLIISWISAALIGLAASAACRFSINWRA
jgi:hypothetical protein